MDQVPCFSGCAPLLPPMEASAVALAWADHCQSREAAASSPLTTAVAAAPVEVAGIVALCTRCRIPHSATYGALTAFAALMQRAAADLRGTVSRITAAACCVYASWKATSQFASLRVLASDPWLADSGVRARAVLEAEPELLATAGYSVLMPHPWRVMAAVLDSSIAAGAAAVAFPRPSPSHPEGHPVADAVFAMEIADELEAADPPTSPLQGRARVSPSPGGTAALFRPPGAAAASRASAATAPAEVPVSKHRRAALRTFYHRCGVLLDATIVALCTPAGDQPAPRGIVLDSPLWPLAVLHLSGVVTPEEALLLLGAGPHPFTRADLGACVRALVALTHPAALRKRAR